MGRIEEPGKFERSRQLQRCAESGTSRSCTSWAFQGLSMTLREVSFERNKIMKLINSIFAACVTMIGFIAFANPIPDGKNYTEKV